MRPQRFGTYTPADVSPAGLANNVAESGLSFALTANDSGDDMAHIITILGNDITDHSGKTFTITGTDIDDHAQTEGIAGPNGVATVSTTKYFKTVTSVTVSSTTGADTFDIGWDDPCVTPTFSVNWRQKPFSVSVGVTVTGTINYDVQHTFTDIWGSAVPTWFDHSSLAAKTASADGNYAYPVTGIRFLVNTLTAGATITGFIIQGE